MLDLSPSTRALDVFHRRFIDEGLPPELYAEAFAAFDPRRYTEGELERGRRAWQQRTLDEYRAQVAFTALLAELTELGLSFDLLDVAVRVVRDEARHVELCRRMVRALGGGDLIPGELAASRPRGELPLRRRAMRTLVGSLCVGETLSVRLLAAVRDGAVDALARTTLGCLVADESIHARFGWALLEHVLPSLSAGDRQDLEELIPRWCIAAELGFARGGQRGEAPAGEGPRLPFGALGAQERAALFYRSLEEDVLARFDQLGFSGHRAWATDPRRQAA